MIFRSLDLEDATPLEGLTSPGEVARALRAGDLPPDRAFDQFMPDALQIVAGRHWTPIAVAVFAARWLEQLGVRHVVDIGSGAGKFCIVGATVTQLRFTGIEQRRNLIEVAGWLSRIFEVDERVRFLHALFRPELVPSADAYYLFNPFEENVLGERSWIDAEVEHTPRRLREDVMATERLLRGAAPGSYVVTYHGFGGRLPWGYDEVHCPGPRPPVLQMWRKTPPLDDHTPGPGHA